MPQLKNVAGVLIHPNGRGRGYKPFRFVKRQADLFKPRYNAIATHSDQPQWVETTSQKDTTEPSSKSFFDTRHGTTIIQLCTGQEFHRVLRKIQKALSASVDNFLDFYDANNKHPLSRESAGQR